MAKAFFFSVACGLTFPSIITKSGSMVDSVTSQVSQLSIKENASAIREAIAKGDTDSALDIAKIKNASKQIILAEKNVEGSAITGALAVNDALTALGKEASEGDIMAITAIVDIGKLSSRSKSIPTFTAINELKTIQNTPGIDEKTRSDV